MGVGSMDPHSDGFRMLLPVGFLIGEVIILYATKTAKIGRLKFLGYLIGSIAALMASILVMDFVSPLLGGPLFICVMLFFVYAMACRMNDLGHSRWWLIFAPTGIGSIIILPMLFFFPPSSPKTEPMTNQFDTLNNSGKQ